MSPLDEDPARMAMNDPATTRQRLDPTATVATLDPAIEPVPAAGVRDIAGRLFRHGPPAPSGTDRTIDIADDALTASRLPRARPVLRSWRPSRRRHT